MGTATLPAARSTQRLLRLALAVYMLAAAATTAEPPPSAPPAPAASSEAPFP